MKRILVIDDDIYIGNLLEEILTRAGYQVLRAYSGTEALLTIPNVKPDLVLLDLMLPGLPGEQILPQLRGIPVIVVSARADVDHKVELLTDGAVDYITKPFNNRELLARIAVALRAPAVQACTALEYAALRLEPETHQVFVDCREVRLTRTEFAILKLLLQNPTRVVTKSFLLEHISRDTPDCTESSLKQHISNLRKKLRERDGREYIEAVWGIGFKLSNQSD